MSDYKTLRFADVNLGDKLPALEIPITAALVVGGALATRDYEPVHHDKSAAQAAGLPDVFMNILTSQGLMTRFATDWSGPEAVVKSLDIKLGAPNLPGMVMTVTGEVTALDKSNGVVDVAVQGENNIWGMHMQGTVQLALPEAG
ncbi:MAG: acyl dehydratase [Gammaproteobacteria bacterium]|nr:acyl dehydratase [Gammaproteobacteria bacterium]NND38526.1 acyl dehydratase [Pseudomonadales bacterium]NNM10794.1 acyl dehydratase [Pseudomonadales bacterium]